jgi:hypothetical protein
MQLTAKNKDQAYGLFTNVEQNFEFMLRPGRMDDYPADLRQWVISIKPEVDKLYTQFKVKTHHRGERARNMERPMTHPELLALAFAAMLFGVVLLFFSIRAVLGVMRDSEVARMPAAAEQTVSFPAGGAYVLHLSQPRLSKALAHAKFSLRDGGAEVPSMPEFTQVR